MKLLADKMIELEVVDTISKKRSASRFRTFIRLGRKNTGCCPPTKRPLCSCHGRRARCLPASLSSNVSTAESPISRLFKEIAARELVRNKADCRFDWQLTSEKSRIKLRRRYPSVRLGLGSSRCRGRSRGAKMLQRCQPWNVTFIPSLNLRAQLPLIPHYENSGFEINVIWKQ